MNVKILLVSGLTAAVGFGLLMSPAHATGSITAADTQTGQIGHAFASCTAGLGSTDSLQQAIYFPAVTPPDAQGKRQEVGAVVGQAFYISNKGPQMRDLLLAGWTPQQIVAEINRVAALPTNGSGDLLDPTQDPHNLFDKVLGARQYELSSATAAAATYTGNAHNAPGSVLPNYSEATSGTQGADRFVGAAAGNTLTSDDFAGTMASTLQAPQKDIVAALAELGVTVAPADVAAMHKGDLGERLFLSLESTFGRPGQGDFRCVYATQGLAPPPPGTPLPANTRSSSMSWLRVDNADGSVAMNLRYRSLNNKDAVKALGQMYYDCRMGRGSCAATSEDLSAPVSTQNFSFSVAETANVLGTGPSASYGPADSKLSSGYDGRNLTVTIQKPGDSWVIEMTPPRGTDWLNGHTYPTEGGARNTVAELNLTRNGVACSRPMGSLTMNNIAFTGQTLTALSADFSGVVCQGSIGTLSGQLRYTA